MTVKFRSDTFKVVGGRVFIMSNGKFLAYGGAFKTAVLAKAGMLRFSQAGMK